MLLTKANLSKIKNTDLVIPADDLFNLPERVLQFGTGVLLRGLPNYFIDKANREGIFNGRVVVVKSTPGNTAGFEQQDSLYTLHVNGIENGKEIKEHIVCSAISRVLSANSHWESILAVARSPELQIIISNTTEAGIELIPDDVTANPPVSYPGKLLAVLYERYIAFNASEQSGLIIIPTELITDNGKKLQSIVLELARLNNMELQFINWLTNCNYFCSSLVDRIVPGKPQHKESEQRFGYQDDLHIQAEAYCLWAIEGDDKVKAALSFGQAHKGVVVTPDIELFRELKLRILNGSHTLTCAIAYLAGFGTVREAMDDPSFLYFITELMYRQIIPAIPYPVDKTIADNFAASVLDRFRNPSIEHKWISISVQYSLKMKMRVVPLLVNHYKINNSVPEYFALGFAAFLRFMMISPDAEGNYKGNNNGIDYVITDSQAETFYMACKNADVKTFVHNILSNIDLWETNLAELHGFEAAVTQKLENIISNGAASLLINIYHKGV